MCSELEGICSLAESDISTHNPTNLFFVDLKKTMKEGKSAGKLNNSNNQQQHQHQNGHFSPFKLAKLLDPEASWDKDQLGDALHWIRQVVALVCGLLWGTIPLVGGIWIGLFLLISSGIIYGYYALILKIDEEDFGGHSTLLQEGLFASITLFLLSWILVYSLAHF
ncbi:respirasome Complex Assembly Factor [Salix suchowensis]|nr:respirasome Complex Assembly Factor [Salix suchowensis]